MKWVVVLLVAVIVLLIIAAIIIKQKTEALKEENHEPNQLNDSTKNASNYTVESETIVNPSDNLASDTAITSEPIAATIASEITPIAVQSEIIEAKAEQIPEDSVLKRHYLSHKASEKLALTNPYPTDSALRRHYQSLQASLLNQSQTLSNPVIEDNIASEQVEIAITPEILLVAPKITDNEPSKPTITKTPVIPEDATLRRHFLTHVQSEVANLLGNRPTDSTLKRHYDSLFSSKVSEYLAG